jgi:hypothetical protein
LKKVVFLTFNDAPTGIFSGQVVDVCRFLEKECNADVTLISFISIRGFSENKKKIKAGFPRAIVLRMFPKMRNWKLNKIFLKRYIRKIKPSIIIARGPFATDLAFNFSAHGRKICFDGRGAYVPELKEYNVVPDARVKNEIEKLERKAVLGSDFRIAVSEALVNYWKRSFQYSGNAHVVIPCTLNSGAVPQLNTFDKPRESDFHPGDIIIAYSGSDAGWQSLNDLSEKLLPAFRKNNSLQLLLLLKNVPENFALKKEFPSRVKSTWVAPEKVTEILSSCDYGWLVRERSVTNEVASPVKFAEYLAAGLSVIISEDLGDYTAFVRENNCGMTWSEEEISFKKTSPAEKMRLHQLALDHFTKEKFKDAYLSILR